MEFLHSKDRQYFSFHGDVLTYCMLNLHQSMSTRKEPIEKWSVSAGVVTVSWGSGQVPPKFGFVTS